jgi:hypothetical protein
VPLDEFHLSLAKRTYFRLTLSLGEIPCQRLVWEGFKWLKNLLVCDGALDAVVFTAVKLKIREDRVIATNLRFTVVFDYVHLLVSN